MTNRNSAHSVLDDDKKEASEDLDALKADLSRVHADLATISASLLKLGKHTLQSAGSDVSHYAQDSAKEVKNFVRERPVSTALVALGVGLVAGMILKKH
ncbi:MAG: hypothetical protein HQ492_04055 [Woeseiaceae bacterium]|nr:hypothetical protein [Woeseiaceae bacterium]